MVSFFLSSLLSGGEGGKRGGGCPTEINHELNDLKTGDPLLPPDADPTGTLEVVPVHHNVDHEVQGNGDP